MGSATPALQAPGAGPRGRRHREEPLGNARVHVRCAPDPTGCAKPRHHPAFFTPRAAGGCPQGSRTPVGPRGEGMRGRSPGRTCVAGGAAGSGAPGVTAPLEARGASRARPRPASERAARPGPVGDAGTRARNPSRCCPARGPPGRPRPRLQVDERRRAAPIQRDKPCWAPLFSCSSPGASGVSEALPPRQDKGPSPSRCTSPGCLGG